MFGFKIITQYEKGIVFRFGRALPGIREAGLTWVNPFTSRLRKVNMQIVVAAVPGQEAITRDNVPPPRHQPPSERCHTDSQPQPSRGGNGSGVLVRALFPEDDQPGAGR